MKEKGNIYALYLGLAVLVIVTVVKRGLDPNKWFNNVEVMTAEKIGFQTTTYVRSIYKYYVAYKLTLKNMEEKRNAREQILLNKNQKSK